MTVSLCFVDESKYLPNPGIFSPKGDLIALTGICTPTHPMNEGTPFHLHSRPSHGDAAPPPLGFQPRCVLKDAADPTTIPICPVTFAIDLFLCSLTWGEAGESSFALFLPPTHSWFHSKQLGK